MSISEENKKMVAELSGAQHPSYTTQQHLESALHRFQYHFPSMNWWGNTPIEPTGAGLTYAESITWIRHMLHHMADWAGQMSEELKKLEQDLKDLNIVIKNELADQMPEIIQKYKLFDIIVTGNNERVEETVAITTTAKKEQSVFTYGFQTEYGFVEATKTNERNIACESPNATWVLNVNERDNDQALSYFTVVQNIPAEVNRVWVLHQENSKLDSKKELFYIHKNQIRKATFDKNTGKEQQSVFLTFDKLNTNYEPQWIVNVFKKLPSGKNLLHYMTLDYKVYEYDLTTGEETLLYQIPIDKQEIFDPISDVIEGKDSIWAVTYRGTTQRLIKEMNGLCTAPCFDSVEMYDKWETPEKLVFSRDYLGITPANMYQDYANRDEKTGDKQLLSAFILSEKAGDYPQVVKFYTLLPRKFDNRIVATNLEKYFKESIVKDLYDHQSLADFQGYFSYHLPSGLENFKDAPLFLVNDTKKKNDGAQFTLENSEFIANGSLRTFWQRIKVFVPETSKTRNMRIFERSVEQKILLGGFVLNRFSRWSDVTTPISSEKLNQEVVNDKLDYLSLAGTKRIYNAADYEKIFSDTPIRTYKYYKLPLDTDHPLLQKLTEKNVVIEVTKGTNFEKDDQQYEIVFKLTYQDEYGELQFRRLMRFDRKTPNDQFGGRNRANYVSPWAYVYYTTPDDSAPAGYEKNPNQGIDQKFEDIINNLQNQINQNKEEIKNINNKIDQINKEIKDIKNDIKNINEQIQNIINKQTSDGKALEKILEKLKETGVWIQEGDTINNGKFAPGKGIAAGNINVFGGKPDGDHWIRTNSGKTENDLAGGV